MGRKRKPRICRVCNDDLVIDLNYTSGLDKYGNLHCIPCWSKKCMLRNKNSDSFKVYQREYRKRDNKSEGHGIYQVLLDNICLYVGEGQLKGRRKKHLNGNAPLETSRVVEYCREHNINRELLSFNVLEYEDDKAVRKQKEDWYITFLNPIINPTPPLGIYV